MEIIQVDLCYMPHDKIGNKIYKYALTCVDIASQTKWICLLTEWDSGSVAKGFIKLFKFHNFPLIQLKTLQGIVERFNQTLQKWAFFIQDAVELLLPSTEHCRDWVTDFPIFLEKLDNTKTQLIDMSLAEARKLKHVYAKSSKPRYGPMGYDEIRLTYSDSVLYLFNPGELEVEENVLLIVIESLVQKNQPVLYWIEDIDNNGPKWSFVREELMVVRNIEYSPQKILSRSEDV
ncbi:hypothetical protein Glove_199g51 [Diversispora epigaea]|uniref:Integrase catalytic domain-containing protein n=1 Tax=Diversispora epigaea TaxID=1348612 RepID=A0A397IK27_9GLOM|nr:hypothetical protein Glove_199g51 [Diversispora epigaea]